MLTPSSKKSTSAIATLSVAVADTVIVPDTVEPDVGAVPRLDGFLELHVHGVDLRQYLLRLRTLRAELCRLGGARRGNERIRRARPALSTVLNATPLGVHGERLPLPTMGEGVVAVDLLYRPSATPFQTAAREAGAVVFGGLGLLLRQAALSFELWTGRAAPLPVMSAAALGELAES